MDNIQCVYILEHGQKDKEDVRNTTSQLPKIFVTDIFISILYIVDSCEQGQTLAWCDDDHAPPKIFK